MSTTTLLEKMAKPGEEFYAGMIHIDIVNHSKLPDFKREVATTKENLKKLIESQIDPENAMLFPWKGDGGVVLFDVKKKDGCDDLILFCDQLKHLVPFFNNSRGKHNVLPFRQEICLRIVCHAGLLINQTGDAGLVSGDSINDLHKKEKVLGKPGHIVISEEIFKRLSPDFRDRCSFIQEDDKFVQAYTVDGNYSLGRYQNNNRKSDELKEWISDKVKTKQYTRLLYFAYTNELLYDFLGYNLEDIEIFLVVRNWVKELEDQRKFNENMKILYQEEDLPTKRRWFKSDVIKTRAREIQENNKEDRREIHMRFYDSPPLFNGAIFENDDNDTCALIGFSKWEEAPDNGGSQYQLRSWPALILDSRDHVQSKMIDYFSSRFWELWKNGLTYDEVEEQEARKRIFDTEIINKFWELDDKPYMIVFPRRVKDDSIIPSIHIEDVMSFHEIERFLLSNGRDVTLQSIRIPSVPGDNWYKDEYEKIINDFDGHVVFICNKSVSPKTWEYLEEQGFPFRISGIEKNSPKITHRLKKEVSLDSPIDWKSPEARDFAIIGKFNRPKADTKGYLISGIRGMGTWGASVFLTNEDKLRKLITFVEDTDQFGAVAEVSFDLEEYKVLSTSLRINPEPF